MRAPLPPRRALLPLVRGGGGARLASSHDDALTPFLHRAAYRAAYLATSPAPPHRSTRRARLFR